MDGAPVRGATDMTDTAHAMRTASSQSPKAACHSDPATAGPAAPARAAYDDFAARAARMAGPNTPRRNGDGPGTSVITRTKPQTKRPSLYRVLLLNDDYTPMEFVVHVLQRFFNKTTDEANRIMLHVHHHGVGECGVFTYEVAETKVTQVMDFARKHQHPLQCVMEKK
jgi:ATP-dependent Clp protease adaptor protein ClpS